MSKILIIPDVHGRTFWLDAIMKCKDDVDKIIFLGDYLDPYPNEGIMFFEALEMFDEIIDIKKEMEDKIVLLIGNHDAHHFLDGMNESTRFSTQHAKKVEEIFKNNINLFKLVHEETINGKKVLFSHAGVTKSWYEDNKDVIGELNVDNLNNLINSREGVITLTQLSHFRTWLTYSKTGSVLWSDVRERLVDGNEDVDEFDFQIFGHTQLNEDPVITEKWACLDCRRAFILDEDGKLTAV
jgi:predicted phosphodiesterase